MEERARLNATGSDMIFENIFKEWSFSQFFRMCIQFVEMRTKRFFRDKLHDETEFFFMKGVTNRKIIM
jgi:hypothetical protein